MLMPHVDRLGDSRFGRLDSLPPPFRGRSLREEVHTRLTYSVPRASPFQGPDEQRGSCPHQSAIRQSGYVCGIGYGRGSLVRINEPLHGAMSRARLLYLLFHAPCIVSGALSRQEVISGRFVPVPSGCGGYVSSTIRLYSVFQFDVLRSFVGIDSVLVYVYLVPGPTGIEAIRRNILQRDSRRAHPAGGPETFPSGPSSYGPRSGTFRAEIRLLFQRVFGPEPVEVWNGGFRGGAPPRAPADRPQQPVARDQFFVAAVPTESPALAPERCRLSRAVAACSARTRRLRR